ncbi:MAG: DUF5946 family protein [Vicinamibacterales bacterium]
MTRVEMEESPVDDDAVTTSEQLAYNELATYTIEQARTHGSFIHQHVVDAFAAQHAGPETRPITIAFALIGLYLHVERGYSGKRIQRTHMALGRNRREWPPFTLPVDRGAVSVVDVMAAPAGRERDHAIEAWCQSVWRAMADNRPTVEALLVHHGIG